MKAKGSAGWVVAVGGAVVAIVAWIWGFGPDAPGTEKAETEATAPAGSAETAAAPAAAAPETAAPEAAVSTAESGEAAADAAAAPPRVDVVRVDEGGLATIAGTAAPGAVIALRLDGVDLARITADAADVTRSLATARRSVQRRIDHGRVDLGHLRARLTALSPASTLERGYAVLQTHDGVIVRDPASLTPGQSLAARVARGPFTVTVEDLP